MPEEKLEDWQKLPGYEGHTGTYEWNDVDWGKIGRLGIPESFDPLGSMWRYMNRPYGDERFEEQGLPTMADIQLSLNQGGSQYNPQDPRANSQAFDNEAEQMQRFKGRPGTGAAYDAQRAAEAQLQDLFDKIIAQRTGEADAAFKTVDDWADTEGADRQRRIGDTRATIGRQFDEHDLLRARDMARVYDAGDAAGGVAPSGRLVDSYTDRRDTFEADAAAASSRLANLGIDPAAYIDSPQDEYGFALAKSFNSAALFSETLESIGNEGARMRRERTEMGLQGSEIQLAEAQSQIAMLTQLQLDDSMSAINDALLVGEIDKNAAIQMLLPELSQAMNAVNQAQNLGAFSHAMGSSSSAMQGAISSGLGSDYMDYLSQLSSGGPTGADPWKFAGVDEETLDKMLSGEINLDAYSSDLSDIKLQTEVNAALADMLAQNPEMLPGPWKTLTGQGG
jgi:hypothetical protein